MLLGIGQVGPLCGFMAVRFFIQSSSTVVKYGAGHITLSVFPVLPQWQPAQMKLVLSLCLLSSESVRNVFPASGRVTFIADRWLCFQKLSWAKLGSCASWNSQLLHTRCAEETRGSPQQLLTLEIGQHRKYLNSKQEQDKRLPLDTVFTRGVVKVNGTFPQDICSKLPSSNAVHNTQTVGETHHPHGLLQMGFASEVGGLLRH